MKRAIVIVILQYMFKSTKKFSMDILAKEDIVYDLIYII